MKRTQNTSDNPLKLRHLLGYALGDFGCCVTFFTMSNFLTRYYISVPRVDTALLALMTLFWELCEAIGCPLFGMLMDRQFASHKNPRGKFRPWMLRSAPLLAVIAILVFTAPDFFTGSAQLLVIFATSLSYQFAYTMYNIPYGSLLSAMAENDAERASLSSFRGIGSILGSLVPLTVFPLILSYFEKNSAQGYAASIITCALIGLVACLLCYWFTEERTTMGTAAQSQQPIQVYDIFRTLKQNRAFLAMCIHGLCQGCATTITSALSSYMYSDVYRNIRLMSMGSLMMMPVSLTFLFLIPKITKRFSLNRLIRSSLLTGILTYLTLFLLHCIFAVPLWLHIVLYSLAYGLSGVAGMMQWGLLGEAIDYNEHLTKKRTEGTIYGTFNMLRRAGQAIGSSLAAAVLGFIGYDAVRSASGLAQSASTVFGIKALCLLAPALFSSGSYLAFRFIWRLPDNTAEKFT